MKSSKLATILRTSDDATLQHAASDLENAVLAIGKTNWRFIANFDQGGTENFKTRLAHISSTVGEVEKVFHGRIESGVTDLKNSMYQYRLYFDELSSALPASKDLYENTIRPQIDEALSVSTDAINSFGQDFHKLQAQAMGILNVAKAASGAVAVLTLLCGCFVAWLAARSILGPIESMTAAMVRLAEGNHDVAVPACSKSDEIGAMARAVEVFKTTSHRKTKIACG